MLVAVLPTVEVVIWKLVHSKAVCVVWSQHGCLAYAVRLVCFPRGHACLYVLPPTLPVNM